MDTNIRLNTGKRIKALRIKHKMTQEKLAETAGIDYKYLQKIEGKNPPNIKIETIEKISQALKITPSEIFKQWHGS